MKVRLAFRRITIFFTLVFPQTRIDQPCFLWTMFRKCRLVFLALLCFIVCAGSVVAQSGTPETLLPEKFRQRTVIIPFWSEGDQDRSTLHLRNSVHHRSIPTTVDVLSSSGVVITSRAATLDRLENLDLPVAMFVPSGTSGPASFGSIRITYSYPYEGAVQAELSIRNDAKNFAQTIVGRKASIGQSRTAYLTTHAPTADMYIEAAFANPGDSLVSIRLSARSGTGWRDIQSITLRPNATERLRVPASVANDPLVLSPDRVLLIRAEYSVTTAEIVSTAWLRDDKTGFSNTALLHDDYPRSNVLYGAQLVARGFPDAVLPNGPVFDGKLIFVNLNDAPVSLSGTVYCSTDIGSVDAPIATNVLEPFSPLTLSLESLLAGHSGFRAAVCSARFDYSGAPGHVIGRYYAASQSKTYGLYVKLEPFVGSGYNEVHWSVEGDFMPLLTVANFSDVSEEVHVWVTQARSIARLTGQIIPAHGSVTWNLRELVGDLRRKGDVNAEYGGLLIQPASASGKLLVKQHAVSRRRLMSAPYYGSYDYITSHQFDTILSELDLGDSEGVSVQTCRISSGCGLDGFNVYSLNSSILLVTNVGGPDQVLADASGSTYLTSSAFGPIDAQGTYGPTDADPMLVQARTPSLSCSPGSPTRGSSVTCTVTGVVAGRVGQWQFSGGGATVNGPSGTTSWGGTAVVGGTVTVSTTGGGTPQGSFQVSARNWNTSAVSPQSGTVSGYSPASPPTSGTALGAYLLQHSGFSVNSTQISSGPNTGFSYYATQLSLTQTYTYQIHSDLSNSQSTFSQKQYGACGIISHNNLLANTIQHESGSSYTGHYHRYTVALSSSSNNPDQYLEERIATPQESISTFNNNTVNNISNQLTAILSYAANESALFAVNQDQATGAFQGNINWAPNYQSCP